MATRLALLGGWLLLCAGCVAPLSNRAESPAPLASTENPSAQTSVETAPMQPVVRWASAQQETEPTQREKVQSNAANELDRLIAQAIQANPRLNRLYREYQAALARSQFADKLPDPKIGMNVFGNAIETASGSQRANVSLTQTLPWLSRLDAQQQAACLEALAARAEFAAEQLRVVAEVRVGWYKLYIVDKQIETTQANQQLLKSLIDVANAQIATGNASQGDVLLGTLELSQLEERLLRFRQQRRAVEAEINRLLARAPQTPVHAPAALTAESAEFDLATLHQRALQSQPEIEAARLRAQATRWGIEVARLQRRPEFTLSANYFLTDDNRPSSSIVNVGEDPWSLGVQASIPLWQEKYDAIHSEALRKHQAAHSSVQALSDRYYSLLLDLMSEAERSAETAQLYQSTILPQARQTLSADQKAYANGAVEFDRVIRDYRNLLTLELGYHQAIGDLAIARARLQQATGVELR